MDALSSAVGLKVDFDMALLVLASGLFRLLAQRMRGYADAQARQIFRDLIDLPATVPVPWCEGHSLRLTTYTDPAKTSKT